MSTEIKSTLTDRSITIRSAEGSDQLAVSSAAFDMGLYVHRADFLKAVADELDVIVVERSELPEVTRGFDYLAAGGETFRIDFDHRARAAIHLALAEHLDANPPTDPKVEALAEVIRQMPEADALNAGALAEALIATGRVEVTP